MSCINTNKISNQLSDLKCTFVISSTLKLYIRNLGEITKFPPHNCALYKVHIEHMSKQQSLKNMIFIFPYMSKTTSFLNLYRICFSWNLRSILKSTELHD